MVNALSGGRANEKESLAEAARELNIRRPGTQQKWDSSSDWKQTRGKVRAADAVAVGEGAAAVTAETVCALYPAAPPGSPQGEPGTVTSQGGTQSSGVDRGDLR